MYKGINMNAVQKFWPVKFILIAPESTRVAYVRGGLLLSVGFEGALLYFLAPSDDSSSFCRLR